MAEAKKLDIGLVGAGIGGVLAGITIARVGANVTILEAAAQLGEIGAGIQMTPNVARLLIRYGVDKNIGKDLVRFDELNLRRKDGAKVGHTPINRGVSVTTQTGNKYTFDLVIGADGVQSVVRKTLFPEIQPRPPTGNAAFRAIVPYDKVRADPLTRELVEDENGNLRKTMEVWMASGQYIISYPISNAKDFNMVLSHHVDQPVSAVQEVSIDEVQGLYKGYDPRICRIIKMIKSPILRWPLLVTGPLESWSNNQKNIVLMGDAAHSMVNHMAQGAATSMEDGAFLAKCLGAVVDGTLRLIDAIEVYEHGRMPKASYKQQVSYLNGAIWMQPEGPETEARDEAMKCELRGETPMRSPNLYGDPTTVLDCYGYDAGAHAEQEVATFLNQGKVVRDSKTTVTRPQADKIMN